MKRNCCIFWPNFLQKNSKTTNSIEGCDDKTKHLRSAKTRKKLTSSTVIQWEVGAPIYYLKNSKTEEIIKEYPRRYLSLFCKLKQLEKWSLTKGHQSKHIRDCPLLKEFVFKIPFELRTCPHFSATLCNRLPSMRLLHPPPLFPITKCEKVYVCYVT